MNGIQPVHFPILLTCCYFMAKDFVQAKDYIFHIKETIQTNTQSGSGKTIATSFIASSISAKVNQTKVQNAAISYNTKRIRMDRSSSSALITTLHLAHVACNTIHHTKKSSDITRLKLVVTLPPTFLSFKRAVSQATSEMLKSSNHLFTTIPVNILEALTPNHTTQASDDLYTTPHDTLMISRGLYDVPRIHNPAMTVLENNEVLTDYLPFESRWGQCRLEFLPVYLDFSPPSRRFNYHKTHCDMQKLLQ